MTVSQQNPVKNRKWPWILGGAAFVVLLGCSGVDTTGASDTTEPAGAESAAAAPAKQATQKPKQEKKAPGLKTPVRDGKFEFTVTGAKCGATKVGSDMLGAKAQ